MNPTMGKLESEKMAPFDYCTMCGIKADKKVHNMIKTQWLAYCGPHSVSLMKILRVLGVEQYVVVENL